MNPVMDCFFGAYERDKTGAEGKKSLVCFAIPSAGISFKAPFEGEELLHTQYASLLTLLEFIELNENLFKNKELKIFGHDLAMIRQINDTKTVRYEFSELLKKALDYKEKYRFALGWIKEKDNPSINHLFD
jgi:hypothetical protein